MDKGRDGARKSDRGKAKELDMNNAIGMGNQQAKPAQDEVDTETNESQETICLQDISKNTGIVDILEGFGMLSAEAEGTVLEDEAAFMSLLEAATQTESTVADANMNDAGMLKSAETQPLVGQSDSLENINNVMAAEDEVASDASAQDVQQSQGTNNLLHMMRNAVARASKAQQEDTNTQDNQKQDSLQDVAAMPVAQEVKAEGIDSSLETEAIAQPVSAADMEENVSRLVESIRMHAAEGKQEFMVQLKPEFLGKLSVKLIMDSDGVRAQIKAAELSSKSLIENGLPALEEALKERGIDVKQIEVAYEPPKFDFNQQQNSSNSWYFSQEKPNHYQIIPVEQESFTNFFEMADAIDQYSQGSSMEFHA